MRTTFNDLYRFTGIYVDNTAKIRTIRINHIYINLIITISLYNFNILFKKSYSILFNYTFTQNVSQILSLLLFFSYNYF